ncbi:MAG: energy transducer TonB [Bacteroidota bacterium]
MTLFQTVQPRSGGKKWQFLTRRTHFLFIFWLGIFGLGGEGLKAQQIPQPSIEELAEDSLATLLFEPGEEDTPFVDVIAFEGEIPDSVWLFHPNPAPIPINLDDIKKLIGYPKEAVKNQIEGTVVAKIWVDKKGDYRKHRIIHDPHPLLSQAVDRHLSKLRFTQHIELGRTFPYIVWIPFPFRLLH